MSNIDNMAMLLGGVVEPISHDRKAAMRRAWLVLAISLVPIIALAVALRAQVTFDQIDTLTDIAGGYSLLGLVLAARLHWS